MINTGKLAGLTVFITGASRGIGKAIGIKIAKDGANVVIAAKTAEPHPKLPGTIYTAAEEIEKAGGKCLPCIVDVRSEDQVADAVRKTVEKFGGIDILINNCSAISLTNTEDTDMRKYDLMNGVNARGTFMVSKYCAPHLKKSHHAHILNISPPINLNPIWFKNHVAYTNAKYGMSLCALGMAEEFRADKIAVNCLWPRTAILTAAMEMLSGPEAAKICRKVDIMADAAYAVLVKDPSNYTGNFLIDDEVLSQEGVADFDQYLIDPSNKDNLLPDFFLDSMVANNNNAGNGKGESILQKISEVFPIVEKSITPELVRNTQAIYQFNTTEEEGSWYVDLKNGKGSAGVGKAPSTPDCVLTAKAKDTYDIMSGRLKPVQAVLSGKLKIDGNMQKALKLDKLMGILKSKL